MPYRNITRNILDQIIVGSLAIFVFLWAVFPLEQFLQLLNGMYTGITCAVAYVFRYTIAAIVWNREQALIMPRRLFALSVIGMWVGLSVNRLANIVSLSAGTPVPPIPGGINSLGVYIIVCSGIAQIFAQELEGISHSNPNSPYVHGEERRSIMLGIGGGLCVAVATMAFQYFEVLRHIYEYMNSLGGWWGHPTGVR